MYQMIYRISINLYRYEYRIEKPDRYPALVLTVTIHYNIFYNFHVWAHECLNHCHDNEFEILADSQY